MAHVVKNVDKKISPDRDRTDEIGVVSTVSERQDRRNHTFVPSLTETLSNGVRYRRCDDGVNAQRKMRSVLLGRAQGKQNPSTPSRQPGPHFSGGEIGELKNH